MFYGQARDDYGQPYTGDAEVVLLLNSREVTRFAVRGALAPGVNFRLALPLDDGQAPPYDDRAAQPGDAVEIVVRANGEEHPLTGTQALVAGEPGEFISVFVTSGTDEDADGLPDAWEWELVRYSNGLLQGPGEVLPEDDLDGDGVSNLEEYQAGTYAFLPHDFFAVEQMTRLPDGQVRLRFLTSPGITYQVEAAPALETGADWQGVPFRIAGEDSLQHQALMGDGFYIDLYVDAVESASFFRLSAR